MNAPQRIPSRLPAPSSAADHLRKEAADLRAAATRLEALADALESEPFDHPDMVATRPAPPRGDRHA